VLLPQESEASEAEPESTADPMSTAESMLNEGGAV
jgi:hypothetical protein